MTDAPQSRVEIDPIEAELRLIDDRFRIVWNPNVDLPRPGFTDQWGVKGSHAHGGRWEVWIAAGALDGVPTLVWTWGTELGPKRAYRHMSDQIVAFFREWDTANRSVIDEHVKKRDQYERQQALDELVRQEAMEEGISKFATDELGAQEIIGIGAVFDTAPAPPSHVTTE